MPDKAADPLALWRDMVSQWEKSVNSLANASMQSDQFSGSMNQMMKVLLQAQTTVGDVMVKYLATLNLPSRADLLSLGEQLGSIESQLSRIANILERQASATAAANAITTANSGGSAGTNGASASPTARRRPPRTKRPPSATS
jgi:hypothetical protein